MHRVRTHLPAPVPSEAPQADTGRRRASPYRTITTPFRDPNPSSTKSSASGGTIHCSPSTTNMNLCSPAGSATTTLHLPDPFRVSGCADGDQSLKSPATETDFALGCSSVNRTPSGVATGPRATVVAHDRLTAANPASNAVRPGQRITRAD